MENPKQEAKGQETKGQGTEIAEQDRQRNLELQERLEKSPHAKSAMKNFRDGYNCGQSVVLAFSEEIGLDEKTMLRLASPFGGGMGRLREVCGSVSGMFMVLGSLYGYDNPKDYEGKKELYERVQQLAAHFREINGSIVCRQLLGLKEGASAPAPEKRTQEYYRKRPCEKIIGTAALILEEYLSEC